MDQDPREKTSLSSLSGYTFNGKGATKHKGNDTVLILILMCQVHFHSPNIEFTFAHVFAFIGRPVQMCTSTQIF